MRLNTKSAAFFLMKNKMNVAVQALGKTIFYECLDCGEPIQNLLCPNCIAKHFEIWVQEFPRLKKEILPGVKKYLKAHKDYNDYAVCASCGQPTCYTCPYCFTEYLLDLLKESQTDKEILKSFFEFFNYDFGHRGYSQDIDKLGMY